MMVTGVDDIVLVFFILAIGFFVTCAYFAVSQTVDNIHPAAVSAVNDVRERLQNYQDSVRNNPDPASVPVPPNDRPPANEDCPICLSPPEYAVETMCSHLFCANCIFSYQEHNSPREILKCPMCRQQIALFITRFNNQETETSQANAFREKISRYHGRYAMGERSIWAQLMEAPSLLNHAISDSFDFTTSFTYLQRGRVYFLMLSSLVYTLSPLDIIPEAIFGIFGLIDDVVIIGLIALALCNWYRTNVARGNFN